MTGSDVYHSSFPYSTKMMTARILQALALHIMIQLAVLNEGQAWTNFQAFKRIGRWSSNQVLRNFSHKKWASSRGSLVDDNNNGIAQLSSTFADSNGSELQQLVVRFNCEEVDPDEISELLHEMGTLSVSVEVESERPEVVNDEAKWEDLVKTASWATAVLRATIPSSFDSDTLSILLQDCYPDQRFDIKIEQLADRDWVSHVQQLWLPQEIGKLTICLPWHDAADLKIVKEVNGEADHKFLTLEGGAAFGTGDHPTTRLCCNWIQQSLKGSKAATMLDYGCGSAVLALTALLFGVDKADGVDIDKDALVSASRNADRNNLQVSLYLADDTGSLEKDYECYHEDEVNSILLNTMRGSAQATSFPSVSKIAYQQYDMVVANILAPILMALAQTLANHTKSGGQIALSGVLKSQANAVIKAYSEHFLDLAVKNEESDWVLITGTKAL